MKKEEINEWIENMKYDLEKLEIVKKHIEHLIKIRKKDIDFLKKNDKI